MRRWSVALGIACVASTALADEAAAPAEPPVVTLGSVEGVRELCLSLRPAGRVAFAGDEAAREKARAAHEAGRRAALERRYRARMPAGTFRVEHRENDGKLVVDLSRPLRTLRGAVLLSSGVAEAGLPMDPERAGAVAGLAALELTFSLDPEQACGGSVGAGVYRLRVHPALVALLDREGKPVASVETPSPIGPPTPPSPAAPVVPPVPASPPVP